MKRTFFSSLAAILILVALFLGGLYRAQDSFLFKSVPLSQGYTFQHHHPFKEVFLEGQNKGVIHALHFQVHHPKGIVLYFHGQGGNLEKPWGDVAVDFITRGYEIFIPDYRGFGKSLGLRSEDTLLSDGMRCYAHIHSLFSENHIIVYGRSLGTGIATYVASQNHPKQLVLESPYFNLIDLASMHFPYLPSWLLPRLVKYPLRTDVWIQKVQAPIHLFHGIKDEIVPYHSSLRLKALCQHNQSFSLTTIQENTHRFISKSSLYQHELDILLKD